MESTSCGPLISRYRLSLLVTIRLLFAAAIVVIVTRASLPLERVFLFALLAVQVVWIVLELTFRRRAR